MENALQAADPHALTDLLVCASCHGRLTAASSEVRCISCDRRYSVVDGVPVLLPESHDDFKTEQGRWFDSEGDPEFETTRPHGTPRLYEWYYDEKFRLSVSHLRQFLDGGTALTICGGSGMDAEFLARAGARVITSDISLGAALRARERGRRFDAAMVSVVADAEQLPFADASVDVVYVHDGLHHLERPLAALAEMARVARRAISVTEPARALATKIAVKLGLALDIEPAGNRVIRFDSHELTTHLGRLGFRTVATHRYAMYYRHEPRRVMRLLSRQPCLSGTTAAVRAFNAVAGGTGNRLNVQGVRVG